MNKPLKSWVEDTVNVSPVLNRPAQPLTL